MARGSLVFQVGLSLFFYLSSFCLGRNMDLLYPIVRGLPSNHGPMDKQSFGYSAALIQNPVPDGQRNLSLSELAASATIVVGAPMGQAGGSNINTGLIYQCPVDMAECSPLSLDASDPLHQSMFVGNRNTDPSNPEYYREDKEGQLLGASMAVANDAFVVCAPLFTTFNGPEVLYTGKCFMSNRSLTDFVEHEFCRGRAYNDELRGEDNVLLCGTGVVAAGDEESGMFLFGQPIRSFQTGSASIYSSGTYNDDRTFGKSQSFYSERGYQVAFGNVMNDNRTAFITAERPSFNINGALNLVDPVDNERVCLIVAPFQSITFAIETDDGDIGINVGYGFSVLSARVGNQNGFDSLLVGAPFTNKDRNNPEVGVVYYYRHSGMTPGNFPNDCFDLFDRPVQMRGISAFGRYGFALANLGDINKDGYEDVAISAPFESSGTVYIYYSNPDGSGLNTFVAQQAIQGQKISALSGINGFGTSLFAGFDVDNNQYNDLLVASFPSQKVTVLRSRPFIGVKSTFTSLPPGRINLDNKQCMEHACFDIQVCFEFDNGDNSTEQNRMYYDLFTGNEAGVKYTVSLEPDRTGRGQTPRTFFRTNTGDVATVDGVLMVTKGDPFCTMHTVNIINGIRNRETPFIVVLSVSEHSPSATPSDGSQLMVDLSGRPVVLLDRPQRSLIIVPEKNCGDDEICMSSLSLTLLNTSFIAADREVARFIPNGVEQVIIFVAVNNTGEDAFNTRLSIVIDRDLFTLVDVSGKDCREVTAPNNDTSLLAKECVVGNPVDPNESRILKIQLVGNRMDEVRKNSTSIRLGVLTSSMENSTEDDVVTIPITIEPVADLEVSRVSGGSVTTIRSIPALPDTIGVVTDLGPEVNVQIVVTTRGVSSIVPGATVNITWPLRDVQSQHYLLYPAKLTSGTMNCTGLNPTGISLSSPSRTTRQSPDSGEPILNTAPATIVRCNESECINIVCQLDRFDSTNKVQVIPITTYLDYRYFVNRPSVRFQFPITASVSLEADYYIENPPSGDTRTGFAEAFYTPLASTPAPEPEINILAIVLPIVAGVIVLAIAVLVLYLCGFFKRKSPKASSAEARVEEVDHPTEGDANGKEKEAEAEAEKEESSSVDLKKAESSGSINEDPDVEFSPKEPEPTDSTSI